MSRPTCFELDGSVLWSGGVDARLGDLGPGDPRPGDLRPGDLSECQARTFADAEIRGRNQRTQTFGVHRTGQKIPLEQITAELFEKRVVFNGLDTFGQNTKAARLRQ